MCIETTELPGLCVIHTPIHRDGRGSFQRLYDIDALKAAGLAFEPRQSGLSRNTAARTLRGMHFQRAPSSQAKLVRCLRGRLFDVAVDLRRDLPTFGRWYGRELVADDGTALLIPTGFAHGFLTLEELTDVLYEFDRGEDVALATGFRWDDPRFAITWPATPAVINARDAAWPDFPA